MTKILIIEDEADLRDPLAWQLSRSGFEVTGAATGEDGLAQARKGAPDLILLDLMLPKMSGLEVCKSLRSAGSTVPIVMLTALGSEAHIVRGLEAGADDYVTKPFSHPVLLARIQAVLRRLGRPEGAGPLAAGPFTLDVETHSVRVDGQPADLTVGELRTLRLLMTRAGRVYTRQQIQEAVHGGPTLASDRAVDAMIVGLRRKLAPHGELLETVRGVGYRLHV